MSVVSIQQFLLNLVPNDKIEISNLHKPFSLDHVLANPNQDIYFLGGVTDSTKRNSDNDIVSKNYLVVDFDLRENFIKQQNIVIDDASLELMCDNILKTLAASDFMCRRYIVFSGNGYHVYFTGDGLPLNPDEYKQFTTSIMLKIDALFNDTIFITDHSCKNIGRVMRLPGTMNMKRKTKHNLEPKLCAIIHSQDTDAPFVQRVETFKQDAIHKQANTQVNASMKGVADPQLELILQLPIQDLVKDYCGLELQPDKKNFKSPKDGSNIGMFVKDNIVHPTGTHYISDKLPGYNTFLFVQTHYNLTRKQTFDRFRERYPEVNTKPKAKITKLDDTIKVDFDHKLPFSWGLDAIDRKFGKCDIGVYNVIIGESLSGKTEFTFFQARKNAIINKVLYISLEMPPIKMITRYAMKRAGVNQIQRSNKSLSASQKEAMQTYVNNVQAIKNLKIIGMENPSMEDITKTVEEYFLQGYTLFYIDNMGFIHGDKEEIVNTTEISRQIKTLTNKYPLTINLIHHFRKGTTKERKGHRGSADIRSSGKIENDADNIIQVWRDLSEEEKTDEERAEVKIILHKDREFGQTATMRIRFSRGEYVDKNPYITTPVLPF